MQIRDFSSQFYNRLPSVDDAFREMCNREDWEAMIGDGLQVLREVGLHESYGIFLLHKHFDCFEGGRPEEHVQYREGDDPLFITSIREESQKRTVPYRYAITDEGLQPLEFTSRLNNMSLPSDEAFLKLQEWLTYNEATHILGITALHLDVPIVFSKSKGLGVFSEDSAFVFLESTESIPPRSIVRLVDPSDADTTLNIPTVWTGSGSKGKCVQKCIAYCAKAGEDTHDRFHAKSHKQEKA